MYEIKNIKTYVTVKDNSPQDQVLNKLTQNYTMIEIPTPSSFIKNRGSLLVNKCIQWLLGMKLGWWRGLAFHLLPIFPLWNF